MTPTLRLRITPAEFQALWWVLRHINDAVEDSPRCRNSGSNLALARFFRAKRHTQCWRNWEARGHCQPRAFSLPADIAMMLYEHLSNILLRVEYQPIYDRLDQALKNDPWLYEGIRVLENTW